MENHEEEKIKKFPFWKKIIFSIIPLVVIFFVLEVFSFAVFYYMGSGPSFASIGLLKKVRTGYLINKAQEIKGEVPSETWKKFYGNDGKNLLADFKNQYEVTFEELAKNVHDINSRLVILYIPTPGENGEISRKENRRFFAYLSEKYKVDFLDATEMFMKYPQDQWSLLPKNGHLSRFGNAILAEYLSEYFENNNYRSDFSFNERPKQMGDLNAGIDIIENELESMVYRVYTNKQGFRNGFDLSFPKKKQRILFLGDSFTYGPYLPNHDTYPEILNRKFDNQKEFINAGVAGYTITDEAGLFSERAKYAEPDIVVLQVLDNDLYGLFYFKKNQFDRKRKSYAPSRSEEEFFEKIK